MSSFEKCQRFQPPILVGNLPFLANISSLPFSLNILPVFGTFSFLCFTSPFCTSLPFFCGFSAIFTLLASEHELVIVLGVRYFHWLGSLNAEKRHLRGTYLTISQGIMPLEPPRGSCLQRSWAQLCCPKNRPFLLDRVGISEILIHYQ